MVPSTHGVSCECVCRDEGDGRACEEEGRRRGKKRERRSRRERGGERGWEGRVEDGRPKSRSKFAIACHVWISVSILSMAHSQILSHSSSAKNVLQDKIWEQPDHVCRDSGENFERQIFNVIKIKVLSV